MQLFWNGRAGEGFLDALAELLDYNTKGTMDGNADMQVVETNAEGSLGQTPALISVDLKEALDKSEGLGLAFRDLVEQYVHPFLQKNLSSTTVSTNQIAPFVF